MPRIDETSLGKTVNANYATGGVHAHGEVIGYSRGPQVLIKQADGTLVWWGVELCEEQPLYPTDETILEGARKAGKEAAGRSDARG